jgi:hypothetical protein
MNVDNNITFLPTILSITASPSYFSCGVVNNGNADELMVTTTMAALAYIRRGVAAVAKRSWNCLIWLTGALI